MKFAVFSLLFFTSLFASASDTNATFTPHWPATCEKDHLLLNKISEVKHVDETAETVTFQYITRVVRCEDKQEIPYFLTPAVSKLFIGKTQTLQLQHLENGYDILVNVTFNKTKAFKLNKSSDQHLAERKLFLSFFPFGFRGYHIYGGYNFTWDVFLERDVKSGLTKMSFAPMKSSNL